MKKKLSSTFKNERFYAVVLATVMILFVAVTFSSCDENKENQPTDQPTNQYENSENDNYHDENQDNHDEHNDSYSGSSGGNKLTMEDAEKIVLDRIPGATRNDIMEFEEDYEDGRLVFEGEAYYQGREYEFEIDAYTGVLLEWDIDD